MEQFLDIPRTVPVDHDPFAGPSIAATMRTTEPQREVWLASQLGEDASCAYNESVSLRLSGPLDVSAIHRAVSLVVERHGSLRSVFSSSGTQMIELVAAPARSEVIDLAELAASERDDHLTRMNTAWMSTPFDLMNGPLFRSMIIKLDERDHILRFIAHHGVCDGWSLGIIMAEVSRAYSAFVRGASPDLPEAIPFSRFTEASEEFQRSPEFQDVRRYWIDLYSGDIPRTDLPTDRPRPALKTNAASRLDIPFTEERVRSLRLLGTRSGSTLVTTLLSVFEVLLARKTGQRDLVIGLPAAGQSDMAMKDLVGHCVSLLPLRTRLDGAKTFTDHLKARRSAILDAYDHQRFTLGNLLQELDIPREPGRVPLVPVVFNIDMNMDDGVAFDNGPDTDALRHVYSSDPRPFEHFELSLNCSGSGDKLVMEWGYNTDLFNTGTIRDWSDDLGTLIDRVCSEPDIALDQLMDARANGSPMTVVPAEWNGAVAALQANATIWSVFEEKADAFSDKTAVVHGTEEVSYAELFRRSTQLSAELAAHDVKRGDLVAVFITPGVHMLTAMLGTVRCGAAYVPIDPGFPDERIAQTIADAHVKVVLTLSDLAARIPQGQRTVFLDGAVQAAGSTSVATSVPTGNDAAYVIYTSGSTGKPKGVVVPHRGIVRLVEPRSFIPFSSDLTWLHHLSIGFDASMLGIWGALLNGGTLAIPVEAKPSLNDLADTMLLHRVNAIATASGLFDLLVEERIDAMKGLRHLITGGDVISLRHARKVLEEIGGNVLVNAYGPTENSVVSTAFILHDEHDLERPLPIGKPFLNSTAYVLNERLEKVGIGQRGELFTAGPGTALGYLNRPDLTAERFIKDPFSGDPNALMYRTGDMVRWLPNGDLEFFGRQDDQVKIRGFRIELGEIDAALNDLPLITSRSVIASATGHGDKEILAYIVPTDKSALNNDGASRALSLAVQEHLARKLPDHMVPAAVIVLDALPLNHSGKVDRSKLPRPLRTRMHVTGHTSPATETERTLAAIWADLLGTDAIGVHDNFFELGGHSLIGLQMFAQVEKQLGVRFQLKTLFQAPTIAQLATMIGARDGGQGWKNLVAVQTRGSRIPFFCVHGDEANHLMPPHLGEDQPFYGFVHQGEDGLPIKHTTVEAIARHLIHEMRTVRPRGPYLLGGYSFGGIVAYEMAQQLTAAGEEVPVLALLDSYDPQEYRAVMKREAKLHEPLKKFLLSRLIKQLISEERPLPHRLRHAQIMETYDRAMKDYEAVGYKGRITLFRSKESTGPLDMGWGYLVKGGVEVIELEGDHFAMMRDSHVRAIASRLTALFAEFAHPAVRQAS